MDCLYEALHNDRQHLEDLKKVSNVQSYCS